MFVDTETLSAKQRSWLFVGFAVAFIVSVCAYPILLSLGGPLPTDYPEFGPFNTIYSSSAKLGSPCNSVFNSANSGGLGHVFNVDLVYGDFSFPGAKLIDIAWDLAFGRGVQIIMMWITYKILAESLVWVMETRPISFNLFVSGTLAPVEIATLGPLSSFALSKTNIHHKCLAVWLSLAILWVIIFPTIMGAMTGYIAKVVPNIDTIVKMKEPGRFMNITEFMSSGVSFQYNGELNVSSLPSELLTTNNPLKKIPASYLGINETTIITKNEPTLALWTTLNTKLTSPVAPYTYYLSVNGTEYDFSSIPQELSATVAVAVFNVQYMVDNMIYPGNYIASDDNVFCLQNHNYQWGFSSVLVFIFMICNGIWLLGNFITWWSLQRKSQFAKKKRTMGRYRAAVDITEAIANELGPNLSALSNSDLESELRKRPPIRYYSTKDPEGRNGTRIGLSVEGPTGERVRLKYDEEYA